MRTVDMASTLAALAGIAVPDGLDGTIPGAWSPATRSSYISLVATHDCDPLFTRVFSEILTSGYVGPLRLPPTSPNLNAYAERFVRSIKEEGFHRVVPLGEGH